MTVSIIYTLPMFIAVVLLVFLAIFTWRRRSVPGALPFFWCLIATAEWSLAIGMLSLSQSTESALFWYKLRFLGISCAPVTMMLFAFQFTGQDNRITSRRWILFFIIPFITQLIIWTNFHFFTSEVFFAHKNNLFIIQDDSTGPWFVIHFAYSFLCILLSIVLIAYTALHSSAIFRRQALALLFGALPPLIISVFIATFLNKTSAHLIPLSFTFMGYVFAWALFRLRFLDLLPMAYSTLVNTMSDGLLVIDPNNHVVALNHAAEQNLGRYSRSIIGQTIQDVFSSWPALMEQLKYPGNGQVEIAIHQNEVICYYDVRINSLAGWRGERTGQIVLLRDITALVEAREHLQRQLLEIQDLQKTLRDQAILDPLTDLYNRRCLKENLDHELAQGMREHFPVSLSIIDVDYFKNVNDSLGHIAGDKLLKSLADLLQKNTRASDVLFRYGGDEFLIVFSNTTAEAAYEYLLRIQTLIQEFQIAFNGKIITTTLSCGIATFPNHSVESEGLLIAADQALYLAKSQGRNRVCIYSAPVK